MLGRVDAAATIRAIHVVAAASKRCCPSGAKGNHDIYCRHHRRNRRVRERVGADRIHGSRRCHCQWAVGDRHDRLCA